MSRGWVDSGAGTKDNHRRGRKKKTCRPVSTPKSDRCRRGGAFNDGIACFIDQRLPAISAWSVIMRYRVIALISAVLSVLAADLPAKLTLTPQLPELRGTSKSNFEFQLGIKNDSGKKVLVSLAATAPQNFDATFTEQYGSQELNALPLDAGQSKDVKLKVKPPNTIAAGKYKVTAKVSADDATATSDLVLDIAGQPKIDIAGREGVLSAKASAGQETTIPVILTNSGTAPAEQIELSGTAPTGWKVSFEPKTVERIAPNENKEVQALVTPAAKAVAGDYVTSVRASARGESASQSFRVAVTTSTIWGIVGIALIGGALLVMIGAVVWFGRR